MISRNFQNKSKNKVLVNKKYYNYYNCFVNIIDNTNIIINIMSISFHQSELTFTSYFFILTYLDIESADKSSFWWEEFEAENTDMSKWPPGSPWFKG